MNKINTQINTQINIKLKYVHLKKLVKIKYVMRIFVNMIMYRMVLLKTLAFMETEKNNKLKTKLHASISQQRKAYEYQQAKQVYKHQQDVQIYKHQHDIQVY